MSFGLLQTLPGLTCCGVFVFVTPYPPRSSPADGFGRTVLVQRGSSRARVPVVRGHVLQHVLAQGSDDVTHTRKAEEECV